MTRLRVSCPSLTACTLISPQCAHPVPFSVSQESLLWEPETSAAVRVTGGPPPEILRAKGLLSVSVFLSARDDGATDTQGGGASSSSATPPADGKATLPVKVLQAVRQVYELTDWARPVSVSVSADIGTGEGSADTVSAAEGGSRMVFVGRGLSAEALRVSLEEAIAAEAGTAGGTGQLPRVRTWQV